MARERRRNLKDAAARMHRCASDTLRQVVPLPGRDARQSDAPAFSLLEMMIVVAIIAVLATVLVMPALGARMRSSEAAAIAALRTIATQQENFRSQAFVDQDADGMGEFGLLGELAGLVVPRRKGATQPVSPRLIDSSFRTDANGFALRHGFYFQIYLATDGEDGAGNDGSLAGSETSPGTILEDPQAITRQELYWCAYAWPASETSGQRTFFIDHQGVLYQTYGDAVRYVGLDNPPPADAAYSGALFTSNPAGGAGRTGNDGNVWTVVQ